ncbi:TPA: hypothetical protein QDC03_007602, partial [Burkholderia cepacia]|nr:hypothetical protein [Burkholderia cepacia]
MKKLLIAVAVLAVSGAAFAGSGTVSSSSSTSGGSTMAVVAGFGHFIAIDSGSALGQAGAVASGPSSSSMSYTNHEQSSSV